MVKMAMKAKAAVSKVKAKMVAKRGPIRKAKRSGPDPEQTETPKAKKVEEKLAKPKQTTVWDRLLDEDKLKPA